MIQCINIEGLLASGVIVFLFIGPFGSYTAL